MYGPRRRRMRRRRLLRKLHKLRGATKRQQASASALVGLWDECIADERVPELGGAALLYWTRHGGDRTVATAELLAKHGFQTALDLRLLRAGGADEAELMGQLRAGRISIGDRSKVRLLLGVDGSELLRSGSAHQQCGGNADRADTGFTRQLQDGAGQRMSVDTIAIVASVLVGAAGYLVQAYTARRAEQSTAAQAQELHLHEQTRQREHEQMLSQIARADRWLDDCARIDASVLSCCVGLLMGATDCRRIVDLLVGRLPAAHAATVVHQLCACIIRGQQCCRFGEHSP